MNIRYFVNYLRTMKCYMWFVGMQLFISLSIFVWINCDFQKRHNHYIAFVMESILITFFAIEIMFRMIVQNKKFFNNVWNLVDFLLSTIVTILYGSFVLQEVLDTGNEDNFIPSIMLSFRYLLQISRILITIKQNKDLRDSLNFDIYAAKDMEITMAPSKTKKKQKNRVKDIESSIIDTLNMAN